MKKILVIGPSGAGKSFCIQNLDASWTAVDMDEKINTRHVHENSYLMDVIQRIDADVIAVSVVIPFLEHLNESKMAGRLEDGYHFIYLRSTDEAAHRLRLNRPPTVGAVRDPAQIESAITTAKSLDHVCSELADTVVDIDDLTADEAALGLGKAIEQQRIGNSTPIGYLTRPGYDQIAQDIGGKHWASAGSRWNYHMAAMALAKTLGLRSPKDVLEAGTMGVTIVNGSDTMDYEAAANNADWHIPGYDPTILHDMRSCPWPIENKQYRLFVALRVFHHLKPDQEDCFREARRISDCMIIVVPSSAVHSRGIDRDEFVAWNNGVEPVETIDYEGDAGSLYFWK